ncbi:DUF481 domain-containing protein [Luteimonas sp. RD2P54]|uniref:DUF481 domain-containing protein n=1 Tax=Luteimonas endophytica TaxID=3042023 RepID=A0ABT6J4M7_9GAMM|nr:DUF481 domain-containing protein [Luteimonas endophytica]MDH5821760.1 DUF481 domain-containing protein [Luteimonas endophytica]
MLAAWWLALVGLPVFTQPVPRIEAPQLPAAMAVAARRISLRTPCYALVCRDAEWTGRRPRALPPPPAPGVRERLPAPQVRAAHWLNRRLVGLYAPASARDRVLAYARNWRVDTSYRLDAIRERDTKLRIELGTGYRIQPYVDNGTAVPGPVARGGLSLSQRFGRHARISQRLLVETGRENAYLRQSIGLDWQLLPRLALHSSIEMWHDTAADGGDGLTRRSGTLRLRYAF